MYTEEHDRAFMDLWRIYEELRDNHLPESHASHILQSRRSSRLKYMSRKCRQKLTLVSEVSNKANEQGSDRNYQDEAIRAIENAWYWSVIPPVTRGLGYNVIQPYRSILEGYESESDIDVPEVDFSKFFIRGQLKRTLNYIGASCKKTGIEPIEIAEYNMHEFKVRSYMHPILTKLGMM